MAPAPVLLLLALSSVPAAPDANVESTATAAAGKEARPKPSLTLEAEEPADSGPPPYPDGAEKVAIREYIVENSAPIRECYEKRLADRPTLQGKLIARFDIGPSGKVIGATADGISDRELILCVLNAVRQFQFEKPVSGGKLRIAYPFKFEPRPAK
jgi:outer membrane biosynthesis protein TonB